ncbi:hypothetical protein D3C80_1703080 [compost metagenome]
MNSSLCNAIHVHQLRHAVIPALVPVTQSGGQQRFTTKNNIAQPVVASLDVLHQDSKGAGRLVQDGDAVLANQLIESFWRPSCDLRHHYQGASIGKRPPYFPD